MTKHQVDSTSEGTDQTSPDSLIEYKAIWRELRECILSGHYNKGDHLPSETALVKKYKVSRPTAARALHELVLEGLAERKAGSGTFVSKEDKLNIHQEKGPLLGLVIPGLEETEIFEMISGQLAGLARNKGITLISGAFHGNLQKAKSKDPEATYRLCEQLIERKVAGVFFAPFEWSKDKEPINQRIIDLLSKAGVSIVLLDRDISPFPERSQWDLVGIDNFGAGFKLAEHLIKLGCKKICFITNPYSAPTVEARIAGAREAFHRFKIEPEAKWVLEGDPEKPALADDIMAGHRWDACICDNDRTAAQLLRELMRKGFGVPKDIRLAGFDDVKYATLIAVPLTTIHQPCDEIATLAFDAMTRRIANPLLPPSSFVASSRLVVRESCGTYSYKSHLNPR